MHCMFRRTSISISPDPTCDSWCRSVVEDAGSVLDDSCMLQRVGAAGQRSGSRRHTFWAANRVAALSVGSSRMTRLAGGLLALACATHAVPDSFVHGVFGFGSGANWPHYDWKILRTLVPTESAGGMDKISQELVATAHSFGAKICPFAPGDASSGQVRRPRNHSVVRSSASLRLIPRPRSNLPPFKKDHPSVDRRCKGTGRLGR